MNNYKELYLANNIRSLDSLAKLDARYKSYRSLKRLFQTLEKVYLVSQEDSRDQEKCYILLSRYLEIKKHICALANDDAYVEAQIGRDAKIVEQQYNSLKNDLIKRYEERAQTKSVSEQTVPEPSPKKDDRLFKSKFIDVRELYSALCIQKQNILIVDVRPNSEFEMSHIKAEVKNLLNIPPQKIDPGSSAHKIGLVLSEEYKKIWDARDTYKVIVFYDQNSRPESIGSPISSIYSAVTEWDSNKQYSEPAVILSGGYVEILHVYPNLCTNPHVSYVQPSRSQQIRVNNQLDELLEIDDIAYPSPKRMSHEQIEVERSPVPPCLVELPKPESVTLPVTSDKANLQDEIKPVMPHQVSETPLYPHIDTTSKIIPRLKRRTPDVMPEDSKSKEEEDIPRAEPFLDRSLKPVYTEPITQQILTHDGFVGLKNIKNTCYMNTIVQCFKALPLIKKMFCSQSYKRHIKTSGASKVYLQAANLIRVLYTTTERSVSPQEFYNRMCVLNSNYRSGSHEDAMECFLILLNQLVEDTLYKIGDTKNMSPLQKHWSKYMKTDMSIFVQHFYHQIRIQQMCDFCKKATYKLEIENTLALPVPEKDFKLESLVDEYLAEFMIEDYRCPHCKRQVKNSKNVCYNPSVLVIHLKRYRQVLLRGNISFEKNNCRVSFPLDRLKFGPETYYLVSIVLHSGTMTSGHYTSVCRVNEEWYEFNDEIVSKASIDSDIIKTKACAFFYAMVENQ